MCASRACSQSAPSPRHRLHRLDLLWGVARARGSQAAVFTEKAGVNCVVIDSTDDYSRCCRTWHSRSRFTAARCAPRHRTFTFPRGIETDAGRKSFDAFATDLAAAIEGSSPIRRVPRACSGNRQRRCAPPVESAATSESCATDQGARAPGAPRGEDPQPALVAVTGPEDPATSEEHSARYPARADGWNSGVARGNGRTVRDHGAITAGAYSTDEDVLGRPGATALEAGVALSAELTGGVFVNQSAAYSDFHGTGLNPAANASLTTSRSSRRAFMWCSRGATSPKRWMPDVRVPDEEKRDPEAPSHPSGSPSSNGSSRPRSESSADWMPRAIARPDPPDRAARPFGDHRDAAGA